MKKLSTLNIYIPLGFEKDCHVDSTNREQSLFGYSFIKDSDEEIMDLIIHQRGIQENNNNTRVVDQKWKHVGNLIMGEEGRNSERNN